MNSATTAVIEAIANDVLMLSKSILSDDKVGLNAKMGKNTLRDSALSKNVRVEVGTKEDSLLIEVLFDNYIDYIEAGRTPRSGKQPPIDALRDWALRKGISTDNSTLFMIARAIWRDGYVGRPILATLEQEIEQRIDDQWADKLLEAITAELINYFEG